MTQNEVATKVFGIVKKIIGDERSITENYDEDISVLLDSIQFVTLMVEIENGFQIEINDDDFELENMSSINKITNLVLSYMEK